MRDRLELVAGLDYFGVHVEGDFEGSESVLSFGARYFLTDDAALRPFIFGNYGVAINSGDFDDDDSAYTFKAGLGAVAPINDRWGVVAQTGLSWFTWDYGEGDKETVSTTFSAVGLRFNF